MSEWIECKGRPAGLADNARIEWVNSVGKSGTTTAHWLEWGGRTPVVKYRILPSAMAPILASSNTDQQAHDPINKPSHYMLFPEQGGETDPQGKNPHESGAKLDAGKVRVDLILSGMSRAILSVAEIGTFGAVKYTENGWMDVPEGFKRYTAAMDRHRLKEAVEVIDPDSGLTHQAHLAWNALARLELMLRESEKSK